MKELDAVVLIGLGGPENPGVISAYLDNFYRGLKIPQDQLNAIVHKYTKVGFGTSYYSLAQRQSQALMALFRQQGLDLHVYVGMRHWHPFIGETILKMANDEVKRAAGIVLVPYQSDVSWKQYMEAVKMGQSRLGMSAPEVDFLKSWHLDERFIDTIAERIEEELVGISPEKRQRTFILFTALGLHHFLDKQWGYSAQLKETASKVARKLNSDWWGLAFQRRNGDPPEPWLQTELEAYVQHLANQGVKSIIVVPLSLVMDQIETLYDIDTGLKETAKGWGVDLRRARTIGDHPQFLMMLVEKVFELIR